MKKVVWIMVHLCLCAVFLAGCGEAKVPDVIQAPTVAVAKEGTVEVWLLGDFDKNYYSVSELSDMALEEAGRFNAAKQKDSAVQVKKVEAVSDVRVMVSYGFDSCASCEEFLEGQLFFGTVGEAMEKGFSMDVILRGVSDGALFTETQLQQAKDKYLIITDMKANIYCPRAVTHISNDAVENQDGSINPSMVEGPMYILLK